MEKTLNRKLAAIMFTDMVGYTALMQRDEHLGLERRMRHREVLEEQHKKYGGEIIQYFGDGTLSIFSNSVDSVLCAIEIQKALKAPIEVPLRIGLHAGNIVVEKDGIIGDAVNIASRIESFANIGGVLISDSIHDQVKNQHWDFVPLGKFNLKNVDRPFEIYAVSAKGLIVPDANFLQGKGEKVARLKSDIPVPALPILGREKEVQALIELLEKNPVVTVTGTGGMGKTRISLEICHRLKTEFQDGIAFVSMATLTDATEVMPTLAAALDIKEASGREPVKGVAALISDKKALIVLDNLEQVISAAQEIAQLVSLCPNLKILCTSRTPLKIKAEQEYALHPLPLPEKIEMDSLLDYPAIELFVSRAQKANMDFALTDDNAEAVVKICRRMDGLPLALELAAARIRILPPDKLLLRLSRALDVLTTGSKELPERHQTLRATIDWSHSLLTESEQQLFRRLGVFAGGFTLEAAEAVCYDDEGAAFAALDELGSLLDKALVENIDGGNRFSLLQMINDFANEQLKVAGELIPISQKHAKYFHEVSILINLGTQGIQQIQRMQQGALEEANIHAALDYLLKKAKEGNEDARELGLSICGELETFWHIRGKHITAELYVSSLFDASENMTPTKGKCMAMQTITLAIWTLGRYPEANEKALATHKMAKELNDLKLLVRATLMLGFSYLGIDMELAKEHLNEGEAIGRKLNDDYQLSFGLALQGVFQTMIGELSIAKDKYEESLQRLHRLEEYEVNGLALSGLAALENINLNYDKAIELYQQALTSYEVVGDRPEAARVLNELSWVYLAGKDMKNALKYALESIQAYQEVGSTRGVGISMIALAAIESIKGHPKRALEIAAAAEHYAKQEGIVNVYGDNNQGKEYLDKAKKELSDFEIKNAEMIGRNLTLKEVLNMVENQEILIK